MVERGYCIYSISLNILTYFLPLNNYLVTLFHNTICRAQLFCRFLLSASEYLSNMLFSYHLLYFCTALSLIIMLSSHYHHHKSKTFSQLTQCPFTGTLLLFYLLFCVCVWGGGGGGGVVTKRKIRILIWIQKVHDFSEVPFQCILND